MPQPETTEQLRELVEAHRTIMAVAIDQFDLACRKLEQASKKEKQNG